MTACPLRPKTNPRRSLQIQRAHIRARDCGEQPYDIYYHKTTRIECEFWNALCCGGNAEAKLWEAV